MEDVELAYIPMSHLLKSGAHTDKFWKTTFPKKLKQPLVRSPGAVGQRVVGWGIRINECLNWTFVLFSSFVILTVVGSSVIIYAKITSDNNSAFSFGSFLGTLFTLYSSYQFLAWKEI
jgi:hypothetical protein